MSYDTESGDDRRTDSRPTKQRPIDEVRFGKVKVVVWRNDTKNGDMLNFKPVRIYKDGEEWKETPSLGLADLLPMAKALEEAYRRAAAPAGEART
ncbi:MAG: hypothetical protein R3F56_04400 [Planctomycetota bacterium]